jgi:hypothetical protein
MALAGILDEKRLPAASTAPLDAGQATLPPAVGLESRSAVRTYEPEILKAVIGGDPVDVIEDEGHGPPLPSLALSTKLTAPVL